MYQFRYHIQGIVQRVGYRQFVHQKSRRLKLNGHVKNLNDGSVECIAQGDAKSLNDLEAALRQGPSLSQVKSVTKKEINGNIPIGFDIIF